ncbi:transporter [Ganoderma sinense ZZ0214-1]|uniref:non-specific serine/threonine protein kinase n=1 Tax=Ganoderma sinense ZZ0214-1 TaxID=1077348 RepID=A0A2G8SCK0_9APHY|nr:transporter [Ganoderma sinense ZZ0214-1]
MQAYQQGYPAQANKGTLVPGQSITVNKYTVVVERYLSQGGFAHVYLVRTAQPVYNTTHHVLKRIAVPNEAMLSEVKKEVDIMRILKGHPNIVFLIDAAWHRMANGTYEVFILMEFCPGGGIIDMMNRRLRERLTEAEILTIFVEVCEGLAAMHALKPPILHRDLKVENILQASVTSYKLCDFGSATPVQKVPTNTQELRLLETELNRHTTLQYRAPEMIDVHLRRPIDEKSDVWALGVLLYKLCYYTTPFEEHGPLAILNVQYKIPPYPVYSTQMNGLIGSMLKEHGAQRPSVFEILLHVHNLRGTKSRFTYNLPVKEPLSPRSLQAPLQTLSPNIGTNPLEDLVSYKSQQPAKNAGVEAREKVLEAIAPMRRGRPQGSAQPSAKDSSRHASPEKPVTFETKFGDGDSDRAWKGGLRASRSGQPSVGRDTASLASKSDADAWSIASRQSAQKADQGLPRGFDNDFSSSFGSKFTSTQTARSPPMGSKPVDHASSGFSGGFGDAFDPSKSATSATSPANSSRPSMPPSQPSRIRQSRIGKDAFDGLALPSQPQPPTLAEARMSRTGLASFGSSSSSSSAPYNISPPTPSGHGGLGTSNTTYRPPSIHASRPTPSPQLPQSQIQSQSSSLSPIPPPSQSWRQHVKAPTSSQEGMSAEERFPSLEDLDRTFASPSPAAPAEKPPSLPARPSDRPPSRSSYMGSHTGGAVAALNAPGVKGRFDGVRSQQVTGTAMREARAAANARPSTFLTKTEDGPNKQVHQPLQSRPSLSRKHRSSVSMKTAAQPEPIDLLTGPSPPSLPPRLPPQDWLTGPDDDMSMGGMRRGVRTTGLNAPPDEQPKLRDSPSKRASFIERSPIALAKPLEAESVPAPQQAQIMSSMTTELEREWDRALESLDRIPAGKSERERRKAERKRSKSPAKTASTTSTTKPLNPRKEAKTHDAVGLGLQMPSGTGARRGAARSPSPGGLTDNWSPVPSPKRRSRSRQDSGSSVSDVGPEDPSGYMSKGGTAERMKELAKSGVPLNGTGEGQRRRRTRSKGRQSSVHELVDLWGGGLEKAMSPTTATAPNKRSSVILPASGSTMKPPPVTSKPRSASPQSMPTPEPLIPTERPQPSPSKHTKQPSSQAGSRRLPMPPAVTSPTASEPPVGRSRPQSMFISPISASKSAEMEVPSSTAAAAAFAQQSALSPVGAPRRPQQARRSSISDMVQHYEAISLKPAKGPGPGLPAKPAALSLKTHQSTSSAASSDTFSPSAAATRFPKLSPTTSPVLAKANLAVPEDTGRSQFGREFAKHRTSPTGLPPRTSPVGRLETLYSAYSSGSSTGAVVNGVPTRRSPLPEPPSQPQPQREQPPSRASMRQQPPPPLDMSMAPPPSPRVERKLSAQLEPPPNPNANPNVRSPSPEKPYQGVSRLIDRWQRAVDGEAPGGRSRGGGTAKKAGVVSGRS